MYTEPMCGATRAMHSVTAFGLAPGARVWYRARTAGGAWSAVNSFTTARDGAATALLTFDMTTRNSGNHDSLCTDSAVPGLLKAADETDIGFMGGDISYNLDDNCGVTGDDFLNDMAGVIATTPYVFTIGNTRPASTARTTRSRTVS